MTVTTNRTAVRPPRADVPGRATNGGRGPTQLTARVAGVVRQVAVGASSLFWTALVIVPLYWIVITSLRDQADFFTTSPLMPPSDPTLENYGVVWSSGFPTYLLNSLVVTVAAVAVTLAVSLMAAYVVVRFDSRSSRWYFRLFLMGLAIPLQAVIIPVYLLIIELRLYDSLLAIVLPSAAFAVPVAVLVLVGFLRDVPRSLYEAMDIDGAGEWRILWSLVLPLTRPALTTVAVYSGLQVWNGFLFPLILTAFRGQFGINVPATMAAVVLSTLPVLALFLIGRRHLVAGLTAGFTK
jgi:raffinose/stachyose/melibiose transport system permease protein